MKTSITTFALALLICGLSSSFAQAQHTHVDLGALLHKTGLKYTDISNSQVQAWKIPFDNGKGGTIYEYLTYSNNRDQFGLIFITVVNRETSHAFSRALLVKALQLSNDKVGVKFVLDEKHGHIDCQTEVYLPTATPASLKMEMDNVAHTAVEYSKELNSL